MMQAKWGLITLYLMNIDFDGNFHDDTRHFARAMLYKSTLVIKALDYERFLLLIVPMNEFNFYLRCKYEF